MGWGMEGKGWGDKGWGGKGWGDGKGAWGPLAQTMILTLCDLENHGKSMKVPLRLNEHKHFMSSYILYEWVIYKSSR